MHSAVSFLRPRCLPLIAALTALLGCQLAENLGSNLVERLFRSAERDGKLVNGKQEGVWTYRFPSGANKAKGSYLNDKQIGHWTYWYENGNVEWDGEFDEARLSGPSFFGYENGNRRAVGIFNAGLEEDLWSFWSSDGSLDCEGDFLAGRPALRWTYYHPDGSPMAEGYRLDGERVGPWQFYKPNGEVSERRFPMPARTDLLHETWDGSIPRREGFLVDGVQAGRWVTWHPNGRRRLTIDYVDGKPHGLVIAWAQNGEPVARGRMERGNPIGTWELWRNGRPEKVEGPSLSMSTSFSGEWSSDGSLGASSAERAVGIWISEAGSPPGEKVDLTPDPNIPPPPPEYVARTESTPSIPLRAQPWTLLETDNIDYLVARYSNGASNVEAPRQSGYGRRRGRPGEEEGGDPVLSPRFLGTQLPWTRFFKANGEIVDMDDFRSKRKVVLVVLRGFAREVCVYCITQTEALCDNIDGFRKAGAEVFVVYPGERNRLEVFMESFKKVSKQQGEPPIGVLYDRDMELVKRMGISSEFAIPSTFVIDEKGVIRYSYVGREIDDRPSAEAVLKAIGNLASP